MASGNVIDVFLPDVGPQEDFRVTEILVAKGDHVTAEDSLLVIESDKISIELPAHHEGVVDEILIRIGDQVTEGKILIKLRTLGGKKFSSG